MFPQLGIYIASLLHGMVIIYQDHRANLSIILDMDLEPCMGWAMQVPVLYD